jgi:hypothetical protein
MKKYTLSKRITCFVFAALLANMFAQAQTVLKVQSGASITTIGGAVITLRDISLDNDGVISQASGAGSFIFTGVADNTISGAAIPMFDILQIGKTGGAKISLLQNIRIGSGITFGSGLIDLNSQHILLQPNALLNGESETSRITGAGGGYVEITSTLNTPSSANPGNLGAIFTSAQSLGSTLIRRGHVSQTNGSGAGSTISRYYDITPANNAALNATLRLRYFDAELNNLAENTLVLWKSTDNAQWSSQGYTSRDAAANYVEGSGINDFSRWTLSSLINPLPLQFLSFIARCDGGIVLLNWATAQEQNTNIFTIERSADGAGWTTIGSVPASGASMDERRYTYADNNPLPGKALYRIAEHDLDGREQLTPVAQTGCGVTDELKAWPNPVKELLWIKITTSSPSTLTLRVFDARGSLLAVQQQAILPGGNQLHINMASLPAGLYHVVAAWNNGSDKKTIPVVKTDL